MKGKKLTICLVVMLALCICFGSSFAYAEENSEPGTEILGTEQTAGNGVSESSEGTQGGVETSPGNASDSENNSSDVSEDGADSANADSNQSSADQTEADGEPTTEDTPPDNSEETEEPKDEASADAAVSGTDPVPVSGDEKTEDPSTGYEVHFGENQEVTIQGGGVTPLGDILMALGIHGEVTAATGSNDALFTIAQDENGVWQFYSHNAFSTEQTMTLVVGGVEVVVRVTDDNTKPVIGNNQTEHDTVSKAIAEAGDATEITISLKGDVTETGDITIASGKTVTIDLCGHTLCFASSDYGIVNRGNLIINNTVPAGQAGTGKVVGDISNEGTLNIHGGTFSCADGCAFAVYNTGTLNIHGGIFPKMFNDTGTLIVYGGAFTALPGGATKPSNTVTFSYTDIDSKNWTAYGSTGLDALLTMVKNDDTNKITVTDNKLGMWNTLAVNRTNLEAAVNAGKIDFIKGVDKFFVNGRHLSYGSNLVGNLSTTTDRLCYNEAGLTETNLGNAIFNWNTTVYLAQNVSSKTPQFIIDSRGNSPALDLNGYNLSTTSSSSSFYIYRNLTILDSYGGGSISYDGLCPANGVTLTIKGGRFTGKVTNIYENSSIIIHGGIFGSNVINYDGTITIKGGSFMGGVNNKENGTMTIHNGSFDREVENEAGSTLTVNGGSFRKYGDRDGILNAGTLTVNGGTVETLRHAENASSLSIGENAAVSLLILEADYAGTLKDSQQLRSAKSDDQAIFVNNRVLAKSDTSKAYSSLPFAVEDSSEAGKYYASVEDAITQNASGVKLLDNVASVTVASGKNIAIDLNDKTITTLTNSGTVTVSGASGSVTTLVMETAGSSYSKTGGSIGTVEFKHDYTGTVADDQQVINKTVDSGVVISGKVLAKANTAVAYSTLKDVVAEGMNSEGQRVKYYDDLITALSEQSSVRLLASVNTATVASGKEITIDLNGKTITTLTNSGTVTVSGASGSVGTLVMETANSSYSKDGGSIDAVEFKHNYNGTVADEQMVKLGGDSSHVFLGHRVLAEKTKAVRFDSLPYAVEDISTAGKYYVSVEDAINKNASGVKLLGDVSSVTVASGKEITIDLNGKTITTLNNGGTVIVSGTSGTVTTLTNNGTANITGGKVEMLGNDGKAIISGGTVERLNNGGEAEIKGGEVSEANNGVTITVSENGAVTTLINETTGEAEIKGGKIETLDNSGETIITDGTITDVNNSGEGMISISGGFFGENVGEFVDPKSGIVAEKDGKYAVNDSIWQLPGLDAEDAQLNIVHVPEKGVDLEIEDFPEDLVIKNDTETTIYINNHIIAAGEEGKLSAFPVRSSGGAGYETANGKYFVLKGGNANWTSGSSEGLMFTLNAKNVIKVLIDGVEVAFTITEDGEIQIAAEALSALEKGEHEVTFVFADGRCSTTIYIV